MPLSSCGLFQTAKWNNNKKNDENDCLTSSDECLNGSKWYVNFCAEKASAGCEVSGVYRTLTYELS